MAKKKYKSEENIVVKDGKSIRMEGVQNLYNFLFEACNILRGPVSQDNFKDYITPILYFKRISDVYDEETQAALDESGGDNEYALLPEQHRFVIPDGCHWIDIRERTENLGAAIVGAMRGIELANPDTLYGVLSVFSAQKWTDKKNLSDSKIQFMLRDANMTAAKSTRLEDLNILSELLACHIEKGNDIKIDAGISRAINIVNEVDLDSLCALTIVLSILNIKPVTGNVEEGLSVLNDLYTKLLTHPLPEDDAWIDNLNVVGAINILSGSFYKVDKLLSSRFDGYLSVGIKSDSNEHKKAIEILENNHYSKDVLKNNVFLPEYLRLPIVNNAELKPELKPILELYSKDKVLQQTINDNFMNKWDTYDALRIVKEWFNNIPVFLGLIVLEKHWRKQMLRDAILDSPI